MAQTLIMGAKFFFLPLATIIFLTSTISHAAPVADLAQRGQSHAPALNDISRRAETLIYRDYTITYFDEPSVDTSPAVGEVLALAATVAEPMQVVMCTDTPIYFGKCMTISLVRDGCVDLTEGTTWDNTVSSIEVKTLGALCRIWRDHKCEGAETRTTYLNEGDTSRDKVKLTQWNDDISSVACYWDPRGVTGIWQT
jgi:hypothetical protein